MKIIGHRGAAGLAPENTIAALEKGFEHQAEMLEIDLRVTKDGVIILHHDPELVTPDRHKHKISEQRYADLKKYKPDLARFDDVINQFGLKIPLYVEIKPGEPLKPIVKIIKSWLATGGQADKLRLASFSQPILLELQDALPDITKTVIEKWSGVRATRRARQLGTPHIIMNQRWLWWGFIRLMTQGGYKLGAYTINNPAKARRWQRHGLRAVVTDYPDRFKS